MPRSNDAPVYNYVNGPRTGVMMCLQNSGGVSINRLALNLPFLLHEFPSSLSKLWTKRQIPTFSESLMWLVAPFGWLDEDVTWQHSNSQWLDESNISEEHGYGLVDCYVNYCNGTSRHSLMQDCETVYTFRHQRRRVRGAILWALNLILFHRYRFNKYVVGLRVFESNTF